MKRLNRRTLFVFIIVGIFFLTGCWNYRQIEEMAIVVGVAVDKELSTGGYELTVELVDMKSGKESEMSSKTISCKGKTVFDAARNSISLSGHRLYWSHAKVLIISQEIARDGILKVMDWYSRDSETRPDISILISKEKTAKEILNGGGITESLISFALEDMIHNQRSLSKAPETELWELTNHLTTPGISALLPVVKREMVDSKLSSQIEGSAVFKGDKLIGFLNGDDTKFVLFVRDDIKGGVLVQDEGSQEGDIPISLEIFKNKTSVKPAVAGEKLGVIISTRTRTAIDEVQGAENFIESPGRLKLEKDASETLKKQIEAVIKKVQVEYGSDIFGFGVNIHQKMPQVWKSMDLKNNWNEKFKKLEITVNSEVEIRNAARASKPIELGD